MKLPFFNKRSTGWLGCYPGGVTVPGYTRLLDCPEVSSCIRRIGDLISGMTIYLMQNGDNGDTRIKDELAHFMDVQPYNLGTRQSWISWLVTTLLGDGDGNAFALPQTENGLLKNLMPMPGAYAISQDRGVSYQIKWRGLSYSPDDILHFKIWPSSDEPWKGTGIRMQLREVMDCLAQANATKRQVLSKEYKPPLIIAVNSDADLSDPKKRSEILKDYVNPEKPDQPWVLPADMINVVSVKPVSLADLAIKDGMEIDKRTLAAVMHSPAYAVGVGTFNKDEYNFDYIPGIIRTVYTCIQQELTAKLIISPNRYVKFGTRHLFAYSMQELEEIGVDLYVRGLAKGNEVRDWVDLPPDKDLDQFVILENYIPAGSIGDQKKLIQKNKKGDENDG